MSTPTFRKHLTFTYTTIRTDNREKSNSGDGGAAILSLAAIIVDDPQDSCRAWRKAGAKHIIARRGALSLGVCYKPLRGLLYANSGFYYRPGVSG
jgi:hypothetical protein